MPKILAAAWGFGWMIESVPWGRLAAWGGPELRTSGRPGFFWSPGL